MKYLRQLHGFSQAEVAGKLGISRQSYIKYEKGTVLPNAETVKTLAKIYNVSTSFIQKNTIPALEPEHKSCEYTIQEKALKAAQPMAHSETWNRSSIIGYYDGNNYVTEGDITAKKNQRVIITLLNDFVSQKGRRSLEEIKAYMNNSSRSIPDGVSAVDYIRQLRED